ncbi:MAG TPA: PP2C family protein-serine/threonine phosphatase [Silvibacterium sp.]|nr:PP2C family protein-serine/threonine phosphatase [Silvibacterium sp.]
MHAETFAKATSGGFDLNGDHRDWNSLPPSMPPFDGASAPGPSIHEELDSLQREKLDLHNQLFEAAQIQRKLSGPRLLRHADLQFASEVFAARFLSGDFVTFSKSGSRVFAAHGDIAGKGVAAGMWFTNLAGLLQSYARPETDPARIASEVNRHLCYLRPVAPFVTGFIAQIDCDRGELTYCNAGHFPPLLLHADGSAELLEEGGPLLGAIEGAEFASATLLLAPGDTLVAYSDGVLECANPAGEEFGTERLLETLRCADGQSAHTKLMMVLAALQDFANGTPPRDDISLTVIQRDGQAQ